jgi:hypothetical protein
VAAVFLIAKIARIARIAKDRRNFVSSPTVDNPAGFQSSIFNLWQLPILAILFLAYLHHTVTG